MSPPRVAGRRARWLSLLLALLLFAALAVAVWVHRMELAQPELSRNLLNSDSYRYFYPTARFLHDQLRAGELPLWSPFQMAGQPFVALHITGALYPPGMVLYFLLEPGRALAGYVMLHVFLAGLFTWLLAGRIGLSAPARIAAAGGYMLSGPLLVGIYMLPYVAAAAWLPAVLWTATALLQQPRMRWALGLALCIAMSFLSGHAQGTLYTLQIAALYGLAGLAFLTQRGGRMRVAGLATVGGLVCFGLVAPQLLPSVELTTEAVRSFEGLPYSQAAGPSLRREWLVHGLTRGLSERPEQKPELGPDQRLADLPLAALPLILLAFGLSGRRFHALFFLLAMLLLWFFVQGRHSFLFPLYYALPGGDLFRGPSRAAFVYQLSALLLVGMGIETLAQWLDRWRVRAPRGRVLLPERVRQLLPYVATGVLAAVLTVDAYLRTETQIRHPAIEEPMSGAPAGLVELLRRQDGRYRTFIQSPGLYSRDLLFKLGMMNRVRVVPDYEPSMPGGYAVLFGVPDQPPWHGRLRVVKSGKGRYLVPPHVLDAMSVRTYVAPRTAPGMLAEMATLLDSPIEWHRGFALVRRSEALPRAYAVRHALLASDREHAARLVRNPFFDPHVQAVVTDPDPGAAGFVTLPPADFTTRPSQADTVEIERDGAHHVELVARCEQRCLVVLTDLLYPGWRLEVDGEERPILATNAIFRGAELTPGEHRLVYRFAPRSFRVGAALAGLTVLGLGVGALLHRRRGSAAGSGTIREPSAGREGDRV